MDGLRQDSSETAPKTSGDHRNADIIDLADIQEGDLPLVGSKAYHLGSLLRRGFPVPKGFCITTQGFRKSLVDRRNSVLIPQPLQETIISAYRAKGITMAAVRSSAVEEDLPEASWAGIYPTILRVTTEWELLAAVEECFRSLHGAVATLYRQGVNRGSPERVHSMAVLVQEIVEAEAAGILFTMNPLTRNRRELCINAVYGLGEPLASGRMTGDTFIVALDGGVREQRISEKSRMLTTAGELPVPDHKKRLPALDSSQISDLTRMGRRIEEYFDRPQDVEFAIAGGQIHIIQARPIPEDGARRNTVAEQIGEYIRCERERLRDRIAIMRRTGELQGTDAIFGNGNIGELLPTPTPMSFGLFKHIFSSHCGAIVTGRRLLGYRLEDNAVEHLFELICGHPYFNVEIDARTFNIGFPLDIEGYLERIKQNPSLANYPELGLYDQRLTRDDVVARFGSREGEKHWRAYSAFCARIASYGEEFHHSFLRVTEPEFRGYLDRERKIDLSSFSAEALVEKIDALIQHLKHFSCVQFVVAARIGFFFTEIVRVQLRDLFGEEGDHLFSKLLQGLEGSRITQQMMDVEKVGRGRMSREEFLRRYGHLAPNELEISSPRIADDPDAVERMVQDMKSSARQPTDEFRQHVRRRRIIEVEVRRRLQDAGKRTGEINAFFAELHFAETYLPLRETIKYYYAAEYALIRSALLHLAQRASLAPEEIFYLYPEELPECLGQLDAVMEKVKRRQEERRMAGILAIQKRMPPVIFGSNLDAIGGHPSIAVSRKFDGTPVASGEAIGHVRIIETENIDVSQVMEELRGNEIIVMRAANLGAAPLLRKAAGLIMEIGGILAHGACQARESGIPAVVMENATALLREGIRIKVDGNMGTVTIMGEHETE